jgi:hypothetical protein
MIVLLNFVNASWREQKLSKYYQLPQWIQSQNDSEFCQISAVPEEVRSQLRQEDKYTTTISGFRYTVKEYDGKWLVFRRSISTSTKITIAQVPPRRVHANNIHEIKIMSLDEANEYLSSKDQEYKIFGIDPVKSINNEVCVVIARYYHQSECDKKTLEQQQVVGPECSNVNYSNQGNDPGGSLNG